MRPKFEVPTVPPGLLKLTTLKALNPSARYCSRKRSVNRKFLKSPMSKFLNPGPRRALRPRLPNVYSGATANAAGLKYSPPGPYVLVQPDGKGSPTRLGRWKLPRAPTLALSNWMPALKGRPVSIVQMPVVCQPPRTYFTGPRRPPEGISQL